MFDKIGKIAAASLDLPEEIVLNLPITTVVDNKNITVQNFKALKEYTQSNISIRLKKGNMIISGEKLFVECINTDYIKIKGKIKEIVYNMGEKDE
jgi:sporulation protein YqfC